MGNDSSSQGNRGQPLGGGSTNPSRGQPLGSSSSDPRRDAAARQARQNLVTAKKKAPNELQRKEKILDMLHAAEDPEYREAKNRSTPSSSTTTSSSSPARITSKPKPSSSSSHSTGVFMAEPASAQARAAEQRMAKKNKKSRKLAAQDRKNRTADLLFGDGLSSEQSEQVVASSSPSPQPQTRPSPSSSSSKKKAQEIWMAGGSAAEAAAARMQGKMTANRQQAIQERRDRTIELLHGDVLTKPDDIPDQPDTERDLEWKTDMPEDQVQIKRTFLNLANCNPHEIVPTTAKLLRKIIRNVLKANGLAEQEKYGKLRCSNTKIRESILDVQFGVDTLLVLGFVRRMLPNERSGDLEEFMIYDYSLENQSQLWFALNLIDTYYPEVS